MTPVCATLKSTTEDAPLNVRSAACRDATKVGEQQSGTTVERLSIVDGTAVDGTTVWQEVRQGSLRGFATGADLACP